MRLTHLRLESFRGFEELELELHERVTVLVGPNGSGKTTVLEALALSLGPGSATKADMLAKRTRVEIALSAHRDGIKREALLQFDGASQLSTPLEPSGSAIAAYYPVNRHARDLTPGAADRAANWDPNHRALERQITFDQFFHWFREREDVENEERRDRPDHRDAQLEAVRSAISRLLPGYENPRVVRPRGDSNDVARGPSLVIDKNGERLLFDQLSEGERTMVALVADIARRLALTGAEAPLEAPGVVLLDEVELHLHPAWQRVALPRLLDTFPNVQFVVTTHSPIVVASVPSESVRVLSDFRLVEPAPTRGRDSNALLSEVFGVPPRPDDIAGELREVAELIDRDDIRGARDRLDELDRKLDEGDAEVTRLRGLIELLAG